MQLNDYLELKGQTVSELAEELGMRVDTVWRHANGRRRPGPEDIERYEKHTKGAVTAQDWVDLALRGRDPPDAAETVAATG